jgi:hypothetical protein
MHLSYEIFALLLKLQSEWHSLKIIQMEFYRIWRILI